MPTPRGGAGGGGGATGLGRGAGGGRDGGGEESQMQAEYGSGVSESLQLTIVFEQGDDGLIVASVPEVPGALSQGRTREEAREN